MFYDTRYSLLEMAMIWGVVTVVWGISLLIALKIGHIELEPLQKLAVILTASFAALFPLIGIVLAPVVAIYLIYRMADSELIIIIGAVLLTRFIAALVAIGIERALIALGIMNRF